MSHDAADKTHRYPPGDDPDDVWGAIARIVGFVNEPGGWEGEPLPSDYADFKALDAEIEQAEADARGVRLTYDSRLDA